MEASRAVSSKQIANLRLRVVVAAVGIVVILGTLFLGRAAFAFALAGIAALALNELYGLLRGQHHRPNEVLGVAAGAAFPLAAAWWGTSGLAVVGGACAVAALLWYLAFSKTTLADTAMTVFGALYVGYLLSYLSLIRNLDRGTWLVLLVLAATWINDSVAYLVGTAVGHAKLAPGISPGKTWEGTLAGVIAASGAVAAMTFVSYLDSLERATLGAIVGVSAVAGDLVESRLKRELGVKDTGRLIPGHGGFLDRFDSLLFVSVTSYYVFTLLFRLR